MSACTSLEKNLPQNIIETEQSKQSSNILNYAWQMKKNGRADSTIQSMIDRLTRLSKLCNIYEPEQVKATLANLQWKNNSKKNVAEMYTGYLKFIGKQWECPKYTQENGLPLIPTESEIDALITAGTQRTATLLQLLKETGARIGEIEKLLWVHIDLERRTVYITAEKGSNSRILPMSSKLIGMLNQLQKTSERVFPTSKHGLQITIDGLKRRVAKKLNNPRLLKIHPHTFRHWKGTMEYHKTKDIIHVQTVLGHRSIRSTMVYINLENALFLSDNDQWTSKAASTKEEAMKLIETGFEYVTEMDGFKLFRKRK